MNAYGQIVIDPEENLSDKEIYPAQASNVPAIGTYHALSQFLILGEN